VNATLQLLASRAQSLWEQVQAQHQLPAARLDAVAYCFSGRLSPELHPHRPKLSVLLQYWKRPSAASQLEQFMAPLLRCHEQVGARRAHMHIPLVAPAPCMQLP
jgi:hypothetical protein